VTVCSLLFVAPADEVEYARVVVLYVHGDAQHVVRAKVLNRPP
jgi:hypothetical protein